MPLPFTAQAQWIWSAEGSHAAPAPENASPSHFQVRLFRRTLESARPGDLPARIHVSADSRYVLWCNGALVGRGPAKGDVNHQFYDTHDLTPYLRAGRNVLAALVLDMSRVAHRPTQLGAPCSVMTYAGGWLVDGGDWSTDGRWRVAVDRAHRFQNDGTTFEGYQGYYEHRVEALVPRGWQLPEFDDAAWAPATLLYRAERREDRRDPASPYGLVERMIPALEEAAAAGFADGFLPGGGDPGAAWRRLLAGAGDVEVPPHTEVEVILDAGVLTTAYPRLESRGGAGADVRLTYAEALRLPWDTPGAKLLGRRQSLANLASHYADESTGWTFDRRGKMSGWSDRWEPAGGTEREEFEPLHWRAFRYVGLRVRTGAEPLRLLRCAHRFTAYPYQVRAEFACDDPALEAIWRASVRTMRLCAHETFEDCPYYEQMQYAGDTMITSRLGMLTAGDYRLTLQSLHHFDWSRLPDGLTQSRYPSRLLQVIPSWSLHWITMIRDYAYHSGDVAAVPALLPGVRAVLDWFARHAGADGLPERLPYWNITDWCPWWPRGVVPGADVGPTCIISAQYGVGLAEAADLCRLAGRSDEAERLEREAARVRAAVRARFWSEQEGLFQDRPGGPEVSQYGNAWAVLCGAAGEAELRRLAARFPHDPALAPGSFFWWHAGFRALERMGAYDAMPRHLGPWHEMTGLGLDTFVEENSYWRSLCHAWSAHPALEFLNRILGVEPLAPGFAVVGVTPRRCGLGSAHGAVCTPRGLVRVAWRVEAGRFRLEGEAPASTPVRVRLPGGEEAEFAGGAFALEGVAP